MKTSSIKLLFALAIVAMGFTACLDENGPTIVLEGIAEEGETPVTCDFNLLGVWDFPLDMEPWLKQDGEGYENKRSMGCITWSFNEQDSVLTISGTDYDGAPCDKHFKITAQNKTTGTLSLTVLEPEEWMEEEDIHTQALYEGDYLFPVLSSIRVNPNDNDETTISYYFDYTTDLNGYDYPDPEPENYARATKLEIYKATSDITTAPYNRYRFVKDDDDTLRIYCDEINPAGGAQNIIAYKATLNGDGNVTEWHWGDPGFYGYGAEYFYGASGRIDSVYGYPYAQMPYLIKLTYDANGNNTVINKPYVDRLNEQIDDPVTLKYRNEENLANLPINYFIFDGYYRFFTGNATMGSSYLLNCYLDICGYLGKGDKHIVDLTEAPNLLAAESSRSYYGNGYRNLNYDFSCDGLLVNLSYTRALSNPYGTTAATTDHDYDINFSYDYIVHLKDYNR